jgi:hypothetical protein
MKINENLIILVFLLIFIANVFTAKLKKDGDANLLNLVKDTYLFIILIVNSEGIYMENALAERVGEPENTSIYSNNKVILNANGK